MKIIGERGERSQDHVTVVELDNDELDMMLTFERMGLPASTALLSAVQRARNIHKKLGEALEEAEKVIPDPRTPIEEQGRVCQFESCIRIATVINGAGDYLCRTHT